MEARALEDHTVRELRAIIAELGLEQPPAKATKGQICAFIYTTHYSSPEGIPREAYDRVRSRCRKPRADPATLMDRAVAASRARPVGAPEYAPARAAGGGGGGARADPYGMDEELRPNARYGAIAEKYATSDRTERRAGMAGHAAGRAPRAALSDATAELLEEMGLVLKRYRHSLADDDLREAKSLASRIGDADLSNVLAGIRVSSDRERKERLTELALFVVYKAKRRVELRAIREAEERERIARLEREEEQRRTELRALRAAEERERIARLQREEEQRREIAEAAERRRRQF